MEDAFTIGERLKKEAQLAKEQNALDADWQTLRSIAYGRDKGKCWVCGEFVTLQDYDLGHLVDRCVGGLDIPENVAVMHFSCNHSKPVHSSIEEHMAWLLKVRHQQSQTMPMFNEHTPITKTYPYRRNNHHKPKEKVQLSMIDTDANKRLIDSYFQSSPTLQQSPDAVKLEIIKLLGKMVDTSQKRGHVFRQSPRVSTRKKALSDARHEALCKQIKPSTLCWVQGRPMAIGGVGAPMWRVLPPPYTKDAGFSLRQTPPGAKDIEYGGIRETMQVIGGGRLEQEVTIAIGYIRYTVSQLEDETLSIKVEQTTTANAGKRSVGMGANQIPIEVWKAAKKQGITFKDFLTHHTQQKQSPPQNASA